MENKRCPKCNTHQPLESFSKKQSNKDGLQIHCKSCIRQYNMAHWRNKQKHQKTQNREKQSAWVSHNREHRKQYQRDYYAKTVTRRKAASKAWARKNRALVRAYCQKRAAKLKNATGWNYTTALLIEQRWLLYEGKCWVCGCEAEAIDHVKPLDKGGAHLPANLRPICKPCNSSKGSKWPL